MSTPSQSHAAPAGGVARAFDPLFEKYRGAIPLEYLRVLADYESGANPNARNHAARGLLQILPAVLADYNTRHGTAYQPDHLFDPAINIAIGCELLRLIIASYHRHHAQVPNLRADWDNPRFVELLTFGWHAGFSEVGGVGLVASFLEQRGITELTIDRVHQAALVAGASKYLADGARVRWCKNVVAGYARERADRTRYRDASWWSVKTPGVILDEMRAAKSEIEALGRDIYATFRDPFKAQQEAAEARFLKTYGRKPGVGREAKDTDYQVVHSWMVPVPTAADVERTSYQGTFVKQWGEFEREFAGFWSSHSSWTERMWRGAYDKAVEYRQRAADWRRLFERLGGAPTTPEPKPPTEHILPPGFSISWKPFAVVGGVLAGALVLPAVIRASRGG